MMTEAEIPHFVEDVVETGCEITAVLGEFYVIADSDLPVDVYTQIAPRLAEIGETYGARDHLHQQIVDYLISIGRSYPPGPKHEVLWSGIPGEDI